MMYVLPWDNVDVGFDYDSERTVDDVIFGEIWPDNGQVIRCEYSRRSVFRFGDTCFGFIYCMSR